jgi:hypothetical protein
VGELGEKHCRKMTQHAESAGLGFHPLQRRGG